MMRKSFRVGLKIGLLVAVAVIISRIIQSRQRPDVVPAASPAGSTERWPPVRPTEPDTDAAAEPARPEPAMKAAPPAEPESEVAKVAWVEPDGAVCPTSHPIKAKMSSKIFHLPGMAFYGASKAAVMHFCETLAVDLKDAGIDVTVLAPGFVATPLTAENPHKMPFLLTSEQAVTRMVRAIDKRRTRVVFPWPMALLAGLLYHLPRGLYIRFMRLDLIGLRQD